MFTPDHPLFQAAMQLSPAERLDFAEQLMMTVDDEEAARIDAAIARECTDRLVAYKRGELEAAPADDLLSPFEMEIEARIEAARKDPSLLIDGEEIMRKLERGECP